MPGAVFIIGFLSGSDVTFNVGTVMEKRVRLQGTNTGPTADLADAAAAIAAHRITPVVARIFPMAEAAAAYTYVSGGDHFGKVALTVD